jgi:hypothetical protein
MRETTTERLEIVAAVDRDPKTACLLAPLVDTLCVAPFYRGCSRAWNDALREATADKIVLAADDLSWGDGWAEAALQGLSELPDGWGMVGFNDGNGTETDFATHYLVSRRFLIEHTGGVIAWECYRHSFNDVEMTERAKRAGRYVWAEDAKVPHAHWLYGGRSQDETDTRNLGAHAESERAYKERAAAGFPDDYPPIIHSAKPGEPSS